MSRVHWVGGEKGGVGKSVLARLLGKWCADQGATWFAFDADPLQAKLLGMSGARGHAVDLQVFQSADRILERALNEECDVIVDLPAHSRAALTRWMEQSDVYGIAEERGIQLVFWCVTDGGFDSLRAIEHLALELPPSVELVVVRNQRWPQTGALEGSELGRRLRARGGRSIDLSALDAALMYKVEARQTSWAEVLTESESAPTALGPMERQRLTLWLGQVRAQLAPILSPVAAEVEAAPPMQAVGAREQAPPAELETQQGEGQELEAPQSEGQELEAERLEVASSASARAWPTPGVIGGAGARTWTEVGEGYQVHHVRFT